jgi:hypothetical protein
MTPADLLIGAFLLLAWAYVLGGMVWTRRLRIKMHLEVFHPTHLAIMRGCSEAERQAIAAALDTVQKHINSMNPLFWYRHWNDCYEVNPAVRTDVPGRESFRKAFRSEGL